MVEKIDVFVCNPNAGISKNLTGVYVADRPLALFLDLLDFRHVARHIERTQVRGHRIIAYGTTSSANARVDGG